MRYKSAAKKKKSWKKPLRDSQLPQRCVSVPQGANIKPCASPRAAADSSSLILSAAEPH